MSLLGDLVEYLNLFSRTKDHESYWFMCEFEMCGTTARSVVVPEQKGCSVDCRASGDQHIIRAIKKDFSRGEFPVTKFQISV